MSKEKNKETKPKCFRSFALLFYEEDQKITMQQVLENSTLIERMTKAEWAFFVSPCHNMDTYDNPADENFGELKKAHYHVVVSLPHNARALTLANVAKIFGTEERFVRPIVSQTSTTDEVCGAIRYLVHLDNPEKHQYDKQMIFLTETTRSTKLYTEAFHADITPALTYKKYDSQICLDIMRLLHTNHICTPLGAVEVLCSTYGVSEGMTLNKTYRNEILQTVSWNRMHDNPETTREITVTTETENLMKFTELTATIQSLSNEIAHLNAVIAGYQAREAKLQEREKELTNALDEVVKNANRMLPLTLVDLYKS